MNQQERAHKHYQSLLRRTQRQRERAHTHATQIDQERAQHKRKLASDEAYDNGTIITNKEDEEDEDRVSEGGSFTATTTTQLGKGVVAKPMTLVLYEMKRTHDPRLVHSDLISHARHEMTLKRQKRGDGREAEAYLQKRTFCHLPEWQESVLCAIEAREADKAGVGSRGVMLCLEMGLGKTILTLAYMLYDNQRCYRQTGNRYNGATLIAVPNKLLIGNWLYETRTKWPNGSFEHHVLHSSKNRHISRVYIENCCDFLLVSHATVKAAYRYKLREEEMMVEEEEEDDEEEDDEEEEDEEEEASVTEMEEESVHETHQSHCEEQKMTKSRAGQAYRSDILYGIRWKRVVADESHLFVNKKTRLYKAMMALRSDIKWVVTGTPIQNRLSDICSNFNFVGIPLPVASCQDFIDVSEEERTQIKETLHRVMIRKLKSEINALDSQLVLMPIVKTIRLIEFESLQEKLIYHLYATYGSRNWYYGPEGRILAGAGPIKKHNGTNVASILQLMMQLCIGMRIVDGLILPNGLLTLGQEQELMLRETAHKETLFESEVTTPTTTVPHEETLGVNDNNNNSLESFAAHLSQRTTFSYKSSTQSLLLNMPSAYRAEYRRSLTSPVSRQLDNEATTQESFLWEPFKKSRAFDLDHSSRDRAQYQALYEALCRDGAQSAKTLLAQHDLDSKTRAMVKHLVARTLRPVHYSSKNRHIIKYIEEEVPGEDKVIVFSNSIRGLECLGRDLDGHGISTIMVNGTTRDNTERIAQFKESPVRVLLLSLKLGNVGLNILCANHIIFMHPWWNPNMIEQAEDRIHRLGQRKTVYIIHFIMNHTIELYVLNLSHDKKFMTSSIIGQQQQQQEQQQKKNVEEEGEKQVERYAYSLYEYGITQEK